MVFFDSMSYIGQTKCKLCFHLYEHKLNVKHSESNKSAIAKHCWENDCTLNFHSAKIIYQPTSVFKLDFLEVYHIHKNHNSVTIPPLLDC